MNIMKPDFLQRVLKGADVHHETQGTRIEYDTASFYLAAEVPDGDDTEFEYRAYNMDNDDVQLSDNEMTIVYKFVKALHDTEKKKQEDHKAQTL